MPYYFLYFVVENPIFDKRTKIKTRNLRTAKKIFIITSMNKWISKIIFVKSEKNNFYEKLDLSSSVVEKMESLGEVWSFDLNDFI